jgi:hypothetical protein
LTGTTPVVGGHDMVDQDAKLARCDERDVLHTCKSAASGEEIECAFLAAPVRPVGCDDNDPCNSNVCSLRSTEPSHGSSTISADDEWDAAQVDDDVLGPAPSRSEPWKALPRSEPWKGWRSWSDFLSLRSDPCVSQRHSMVNIYGRLTAEWYSSDACMPAASNKTILKTAEIKMKWREQQVSTTHSPGVAEKPAAVSSMVRVFESVSDWGLCAQEGTATYGASQ